MSHVDEGRLNAWLDYGRSDMTQAEYLEIGAHLSRCAECSALIAEEREVRDRATTVLRSSGPRASSLPSFEELTARARASEKAPAPTSDLPARAKQSFERGDRSERRHRRMVGLAWAASIMAALGLGWFASTLVESDQLAIQTFESQDGAPSTSGAMPPEEVVIAGDDQSATQMATPEPAPVARGGSTEGVGATPATTAPDLMAGPSVSAPAVASPQATLDELVVVTPGRQAREVVSGRVAAVGSETGALRVDTGLAASPVTLADRVPAGAPGPESVSTLEAAGIQAPEAASMRITAYSPPPSAEDASLPAAAAMSDPSGAVWIVGTAEQAAQRLGREALIHPAFPVLRIEVAAEPDLPSARVVHALPGGGTLTVTQSRPPEIGASPATPPGGATSLQGDLIVTGVGPISTDSISTLLEGLR